MSNSRKGNIISKLNVVFATANDINKLSKPLQSRFRKLFLPRYTEEQFIQLAINVLPKIGENLTRYIGLETFRNGGDVRDVLSIGKLKQTVLQK